MGATFTDKPSLQYALNTWCYDPSGEDAAMDYGPIGSWNVSAITNMDRLVSSSGCRSFDADLNSWDVGQVTSMDLSLIHI